MSAKKELDPRTVLSIVFIFISLGLAVNKPLSSHILLLACDVYLLTSKAYRECILYSMIYAIIVGLMISPLKNKGSFSIPFGVSAGAIDKLKFPSKRVDAVLNSLIISP